jgi:hypothetical protein
MDAKESFKLLHRIDPKVTFVDINGVLSNKIDEDTKKERDYYENARDWWEPTNPIGQCRAVIGDHSPDLTLIPQNRSHVNGFENTINTLFILLLILLTK